MLRDIPCLSYELYSPFGTMIATLTFFQAPTPHLLPCVKDLRPSSHRVALFASGRTGWTTELHLLNHTPNPFGLSSQSGSFQLSRQLSAYCIDEARQRSPLRLPAAASFGPGASNYLKLIEQYRNISLNISTPWKSREHHYLPTRTWRKVLRLSWYTTRSAYSMSSCLLVGRLN